MVFKLIGKNDSIWGWLQSKGNILKVISNHEKGTIEVYDSKGNLIMKKTDSTSEQVKAIEQNFLKPVAKKLNGENKISKKEFFDPMVA